MSVYVDEHTIDAKQSVRGKHTNMGVEGHQIAKFHSGRIAAA